MEDESRIDFYVDGGGRKDSDDGGGIVSVLVVYVVLLHQFLFRHYQRCGRGCRDGRKWSRWHVVSSWRVERVVLRLGVERRVERGEAPLEGEREANMTWQEARVGGFSA